jgi:Amidases related to nicotinamidase
VSEALRLDAKETALVLIDLQKGILARQTAPHSAADVLSRCGALAKAFRAAGAPVILVHVSYGVNGGDRLTQPIDAPPMGNPEPGWDEIAPELRHENEIIVTKRQWGAFYGTALDLHLRRRGIDTIVIGGIPTNFGVESTARDGFERGYSFVFAEDAMSGLSGEAHQFAISTIFPRLGRVRSSTDVLAAIKKARS